MKINNNQIKVNAFNQLGSPNNNFLDWHPGPCIDVEKSVFPGRAQVGQTVTYTFKVCNCGNLDLINVTVVDDVLGNLTQDFINANKGSNTLGAGLCVTFKVKYTIISDQPNPLINTVTVSGQDPEGNTVMDFDDAIVGIGEPKDPKQKCYLPVTFTQQGWRDNFDNMVFNRFRLAFANLYYYGDVYSNKLAVGKKYRIIFDGTTQGLKRLQLFLPQYTPCGKINYNYYNPWDTTDGGILAGETITLLMNIAFNNARLMPRNTGYNLGNFIFAGLKEDPYKGFYRVKTVMQILDIANRVLSGDPPCMFGLPLNNGCGVLVNILQAINSNYEFKSINEFIDKGYLIPDQVFGPPKPPIDTVVP